MRMGLGLAFVAVILPAGPASGQSSRGQTYMTVYNRCRDPVPEYRIQPCSDLIHTGDLPAQYLTAVYLYRASAYLSLGQDDLALRDFDDAIRLDAHQANAFANRGLLYAAAGLYDRALGDFDQAIQIVPSFSFALQNRGIVRLVQGDYSAALRDFSDAVRAGYESPYSALWLFIANAQLGNTNDSVLVRAAKKLKPGIWPEPVFAMFLGKMTESAVLAARITGSALAKRGQLCEASFYAGEHLLIGGSTADGTRMIEDAATKCPHDFLEYAAAKGELRRMNP